MNRPLRTIMAVGITLVGITAASANDYYFDRGYDRFPQHDRRGFEYPQCQRYGFSGNRIVGDRFGCERGACFGRDGGYRFGSDCFPFDGSPRLRGQAIPNRPPVRNFPELGRRPRYNREPLNDLPRFQAQPSTSRPMLQPRAKQELILPPKQKGIANLPLAEQRIALKQRTCPVTRDLLGSMGTPIKVQVGDRSIYVCCEGCVSTLMEEPMKYLSEVQTSPQFREVR